MNHEQLVQRFVDQELSAEERIQFVVALGRDESLRDRVVELERLVLGASKLARPAVPESFVANVLNASFDDDATEDREFVPAVARRNLFLDRLWAPRALQWNLAGAAAVACLILLAAGAGVAQALRWRTASVVASSSEPAAPPVVLVRLVVVQPGARVVQAAGDFNGWNPSETPLEPTADGAWTVTLPLEPGRYEYQFVIDGEQWIGDPFAAEQSNDGFGSRNAVLDVRPPTENVL
jgi:anti-sigma factor RsiW